MTRTNVDQILGTIREGLADTAEKAQEAASEVADRIENALDDASTEGRKIAKQVKKDLVRRWKTVDRVGRDNAFVMALGALGVGILVGYLISRDKD